MWLLPPAFMSLQVLHHLWLVKGHSITQRSSYRDVRHSRLCDPLTVPSTLDNLPSSLPPLPATYPITRCLSPAMTSTASPLLLVVSESRYLFSAPPPPPPRKHVFPYKIAFDRWSSVVFTVYTSDICASSLT